MNRFILLLSIFVLIISCAKEGKESVINEKSLDDQVREA